MLHEEETIRSFIVRRKQARYLEFVSNPKTRTKLTYQLAHFADIDPKCQRAIPPSRQNPRDIAKILLAKGSSAVCYVISEDPRMDTTEMPLLVALEKIVGRGIGTILSCIPGRLAFIETEEERFILEKSKPPRRPSQSIRFIATEIDSDSKVEEGIFQVAYRLRDDWEVPEHQRQELRRLLEWFEEHLPAPAVLREPRNKTAICWFKSDSRECISRVWATVHILEENGVVITKITTTHHRWIIHEDQWQIVARP